MAIGTYVWKGGTSAVAQVDTALVAAGGALETTDVFKWTLTSEDGTEQTEEVIGGSVTEADVATTIANALNASTQSLFTAITWSTSSATVIATADVSGVPFYSKTETTETGGGASDGQTFALTNDGSSSSVLNLGPEDYNTPGNWQGGAIPVDGDDTIIFDAGKWSCKYGLWNGASHTYSTIDRSANADTVLYVGPSYQGTIGDPANSYYLQIDPTTCVLNSRGPGTWLNLASTTTLVIKGSMPGSKSVMLDGTITTAIVTGRDVLGTVQFAANPTLTNLYAIDCPSAFVSVGTGTNTCTLCEMNSGRVTIGMKVTTANVNGGIFRANNEVAAATTAVTTLNVRNGTSQYVGTGLVAAINVFGGVSEIMESVGNVNSENIRVSAMTVYGGTHRSNSGLSNVTYSADPTQYGGRIEIDRGTTFGFTI